MNPGLVPTNIRSSNELFSEAEVLERRKVQYPLKRVSGKPLKILRTELSTCLSDASSWITGSALLIDGGLTLYGI